MADLDLADLPKLALTLHQPWGTAIIHHGKDIENRTWKPDSRLRIGDRIWIHAGLQFDGDARADVAGIVAGTDEYVFEALHHELLGVPRGALIGHVRFDGILYLKGATARSPWFVGPVGWILADPIALPTPIPCRGAQGLWTVPDDVLAKALREEATHG